MGFFLKEMTSSAIGCREIESTFDKVCRLSEFRACLSHTLSYWILTTIHVSFVLISDTLRVICMEFFACVSHTLSHWILTTIYVSFVLISDTLCVICFDLWHPMCLLYWFLTPYVSFVWNFLHTLSYWILTTTFSNFSMGFVISTMLLLGTTPRSHGQNSSTLTKRESEFCPWDLRLVPSSNMVLITNHLEKCGRSEDFVHVCSIHYGVATTSRLLTMIGLFCKRAL